MFFETLEFVGHNPLLMLNWMEIPWHLRDASSVPQTTQFPSPGHQGNPLGSEELRRDVGWHPVLTSLGRIGSPKLQASKSDAGLANFPFAKCRIAKTWGPKQPLKITRNRWHPREAPECPPALVGSARVGFAEIVRNRVWTPTVQESSKLGLQGPHSASLVRHRCSFTFPPPLLFESRRRPSQPPGCFDSFFLFARPKLIPERCFRGHLASGSARSPRLPG